MWCRNCQQNVPAARDAQGPAVCTRCRSQLSHTERLGDSLAQVRDFGPALDEFVPAKARLFTPMPRPAASAVCGDLRRLERKLRPVRRIDRCKENPSPTGTLTFSEVGLRYEPLTDSTGVEDGPRHTTLVRRPRRAWGISLSLVAGTAALLSGLMLLVAANMLVHAAAWRWGFALTVGGNGLMIAALAAMAARLWRNSRRLNSQIEGLHRRLGDMQASLVAQPTARPSFRVDRREISTLEIN